MQRTLRDLLIALVVVFGVGSAAMLIAHASPIAGFGALLDGALGNASEFAETLLQTTALLFPALGIALAFRAGLFNIGAEGQIVLGGMTAGILGVALPLPGLVLIPLVLAGAACAGGLWGGLAGFLKARFGANEVISTLMLNTVALLLATYLIGGPFKQPGAGASETPQLPAAAWLPVLIPNTRLSVSFLLALLLAGAL
jgi:simple sugar transport system permease protein